MKKLVLLVLAIGFIITSISAQVYSGVYREKMVFGVKAGANYANVYDEEGDQFEADGKFGFVAGGFLAIPIGKFLGVQPEILFSQKGYQGTSNVFGIEYTYSRTSNFIDIPLLIALKPAEGLTILGGPQYSYLLKQVDKFDRTSTEINFSNDNIRKNILALLLGFDINLDHIVIGARVGWDLQDNNGDGTSTIPRYKNVWYQGTFGIRF
jgi:hypothetical protein